MDKESVLKPLYCNGFKCDTDDESYEYVLGSFNVSEEDAKNVNIIFASYDIEGYDGYAFVLFEKDGEFYEVNAFHCSCYGLEGEWKPEKAYPEELKHRINEGVFGSLEGQGWASDLLDYLERLD